jgi:hypothetical protein
MQINILSWKYFSQFLEWEVFQTKFRENQNTQFAFSTLFSRQSCRFLDNAEKYGIARLTTDGNITRRILLYVR